MPDKTIRCRDCNEDFVFTEREQAFYKEKGFENEPVRCPACRALRKQQIRNGNGEGAPRREREVYTAICAECGKETTVPFKPSGDRPVYCKECYLARTK